MAASVRQVVPFLSKTTNTSILRNYPIQKLFNCCNSSVKPHWHCTRLFTSQGNLFRPSIGFQSRSLSLSHNKYQHSQHGRRRFAGWGVGIVTAGYIWYLYKRSITVVSATSSTKPDHIPSRMIRNNADNSNLKLVLYQYQTCPFCCKVRAYLDYAGLSYDVVEVNSVWRKEVRWSKYKKVPILVANGLGEDGFLQLNDSSVIISSLETFLKDKSVPLDQILTYYPSIETQNAKGKTVLEFPNKYFIMYGDKPQHKLPTTENYREEREWRQWTDDVLVHVLSPNIYRTPSEALDSFRYFSSVGEWDKHFSSFERFTVIYVGALAMYILSKYLKTKYKLKDDVRISLYDAAKEWTKAIGPSRIFMGGNQPNLADLAVYGSLHAIEGCSAFEDMLKHSKIKKWYYMTKTVVENNAGVRVKSAAINSQQKLAVSASE